MSERSIKLVLSLQKTGSFESEALDAQYFSYWGRVRHKGDPNQGSVVIETRSGNLDRPQKNWSTWARVNESARIASPSARFLQYRIALNGGTQGASPELREIELAYMPKNVAPVIEEIDITPANYRFPAADSECCCEQHDHAFASWSAQESEWPVDFARRFVIQSIDAICQGQLGVRWLANDPNSDDLVFKLEIRGVQEQEWKLLRDKLKERSYSWESNTFPDGEYIVRVTASDSPDNPPDQALSVIIESERFMIDNTAPRITALTGTRAGSKLSVALARRR